MQTSVFMSRVDRVLSPFGVVEILLDLLALVLLLLHT